MLDADEIEPNIFWDRNITAFSGLLHVALSDTYHALGSGHVSDGLRAELESQVEPLKFYVELTNCYLAKRRGKLS